MTTAVATNKLSGKWIGWLTSLLGGLFVAWCFYDPSTPKVNLYWFGTIMAIGMFCPLTCCRTSSPPSCS